MSAGITAAGLATAAGYAGAAYSGYSAIKGATGGKKGGGGGPSVEGFDQRNPDQMAVDNSLSSWITQYLPNFKPGTPYTGKFNAPMSSSENQGMGILQNYLNSPGKTDLLGNAQGEINKTLTGGYDPYTSDFYKSARVGARQEQNDAQNQLNAQLGGRGKFFSSEALNENQQLQTRTTNYLQNVLAGLSQNERQNRLNVLPQAVSVNDAITEAPLQQIAASQTYGALPRTLDQHELESQYQEFQRQRSEMTLPLAAAASFKGTPMGVIRDSGANSPQSSFNWQGLLGGLSKAYISSR